MKLWLLKPVDKLDEQDNPWNPWYDKVFGFVVRAKTEKSARAIAHENAGDENRGIFMNRKISETTSPWLDPKYSQCLLLSENASGEKGLVLRDQRAA